MKSSSGQNVDSPICFRVLVVLLILSAAVFFLPEAKAKAPINLDVLARDGYRSVPIMRPQPNALVVNANINGVNVGLVLDTGWGAEGVSLHSGFFKDLKIPPQAAKGYDITSSGARVEIVAGRAGFVELGGIKAMGMPLIFGKFTGLQDEQVPLGAIGFLGAGYLRLTSAIIDLQNLRLYLKPPGKGRRAMLGPALKGVGLAEVPFMGNGHSQSLVDVEINGATAKMIIDTGATLTGVDKRFAAQMKTNGYNSEIFRVDAAGVRSRVQRSGIKSFKIGNVPVYAPELTLTQYSCYSRTGGKVVGVLSMDILGRNWSIIDFGQQKLYFASAK